MQKAGMRWFSQVDKNTKMFSFLCLRKKDKLLLNEIGNNNEDVQKTTTKIGENAMKFYRTQLSVVRHNQD